jgi:hypothetical protein
MVLEVERSRHGAPLPLRRLRLGFANSRALSRIAAFFNRKIATAPRVTGAVNAKFPRETPPIAGRPPLEIAACFSVPMGRFCRTVSA